MNASLNDLIDRVAATNPVEVIADVERVEIAPVVRDEDSFLIDDDLVERFVANAEQTPDPVAGRSVATTIGSLNESGRQALVDPEFHAAARLAGFRIGRPRCGFPFAHNTAISYASSGMCG